MPTVTSTLPDALAQTLRDLGRVDRLAELGSNGPLLASAGADSLFHCLFGRDALRMADDLLEDFSFAPRESSRPAPGICLPAGSSTAAMQPRTAPP